MKTSKHVEDIINSTILNNDIHTKAINLRNDSTIAPLILLHDKKNIKKRIISIISLSEDSLLDKIPTPMNIIDFSAYMNLNKDIRFTIKDELQREYSSNQIQSFQNYFKPFQNSLDECILTLETQNDVLKSDIPPYNDLIGDTNPTGIFPENTVGNLQDNNFISNIDNKIQSMNYKSTHSEYQDQVIRASDSNITKNYIGILAHLYDPKTIVKSGHCIIPIETYLNNTTEIQSYNKLTSFSKEKTIEFANFDDSNKKLQIKDGNSEVLCSNNITDYKSQKEENTKENIAKIATSNINKDSNRFLVDLRSNTYLNFSSLNIKSDIDDIETDQIIYFKKQQIIPQSTHVKSDEVIYHFKASNREEYYNLNSVNGFSDRIYVSFLTAIKRILLAAIFILSLLEIFFYIQTFGIIKVDKWFDFIYAYSVIFSAFWGMLICIFFIVRDIYYKPNLVQETLSIVAEIILILLFIILFHLRLNFIYYIYFYVKNNMNTRFFDFYMPPNYYI